MKNFINKKSKDETAKRTKQPKARKQHGKVYTAVCATLMICVIIGCILTCVTAVFIFDLFDSSEVVDLDLDLLKLNYTTIIYADDPDTGVPVEIHRLEGLEGSRIWVDFEDIPDHLIEALISVEDKNFREHCGVDWKRTVAAAVNYVGHKINLPLFKGTPGGSTITQQLVKNLTKDNEVSIDRKLREVFRAIKMERSYSKDQILESYLNMVSFGNNTNGIQAAANLYFDKDVSELTLPESASIVGITKNPTAYNPYFNYEANQKRKDDILFLMHQQGKLTDEEYEDALNEEVIFNTDNNNKRVSNEQSYFEDFLMEQVIDDLSEELGITKKEAETQLYRGGFRIYSTVDPDVQDKLEYIYTHPEDYMPPVKNEKYPQSAFVILDTKGAIKGIVGGIGEKEGARVWNRATDTTRQPGSTIKPISSYVLAIENDIKHWSSMVLDGPYQLLIDDQKPWLPRDYYGDPKGYIILEEALQRSTNLVPVRLIEQLTPNIAWNFMHNSLGLHSLLPSDIAPAPMSLGALTQGVTPLEMAGAYQIFANGGTFTPPYSYTKVLDSKGNVILKRDIVPKRVISFETATVMNKLLQRVVVGPYGTGGGANLADTNPGIPVAGKTGTTDADVDQWFIGMTPYYVGVCWMGYDEQYLTKEVDGQVITVKDSEGNPVPNSIRYKYYPPPRLWKTVMSNIHEGLEPKNFPASSNVVPITYCLDTGYAATDMCEHTSIGWYKTSNIPTQCPYHSYSFNTDDVPLAGEKPWEEYDAPYEPEWAFVYMFDPIYESTLREMYPEMYIPYDKEKERLEALKKAG